MKPEGLSGALSFPRWSRDGNRIAALVLNSSGASAALAILDPVTGKTAVVSRDVPGLRQLGWLADTGKIITLTVDGELVLYDVDTGRFRRLATPSELRLTIPGLALAPDGRTIYGTALDRESDIWMVELSDSRRDSDPQGVAKRADTRRP